MYIHVYVHIYVCMYYFEWMECVCAHVPDYVYSHTCVHTPMLTQCMKNKRYIIFSGKLYFQRLSLLEILHQFISSFRNNKTLIFSKGMRLKRHRGAHTCRSLAWRLQKPHHLFIVIYYAPFGWRWSVPVHMEARRGS